jgi:DNA-binding IclR family transcriptional regulator
MRDRSTQRQKVLNAIEKAGRPIGPKEIATATHMRAGNVRRLLGGLLKEECALTKVAYGRYARRATPVSASELQAGLQRARRRAV